MPEKAHIWNPAKKTGFLFLYAYLIVTVLPTPAAITIFFAKIFFGADIVEAEDTGSGDTIFLYYQQFTLIVLTVLVASILLLIIRKVSWLGNNKKFFFVVVRYYLAAFMFVYGFAKIFNQQFTAPNLFTLDKPVGMMSPMNLAWTFMGYSEGYTIFTGLAEVVGGFLLLFRTTTFFGSIICFAVMLNVMVMNFCYDIPVKLFSSNLVFWSLVLILCDYNRLLGIVFTTRPVVPSSIQPYFEKKWERVVAGSVKGLLISGLLLVVVLQTINEEEKEIYPLRGIYRTQKFLLNGNLISNQADTNSWTKIIFEMGSAIAYKQNLQRVKLGLKVDTLKKTLVLFTKNKSEFDPNFRYSLKDSILVLEGMLDNDSIKAEFKQFDHNRFLLTSRGYHWINEVPFNR